MQYRLAVRLVWLGILLFLAGCGTARVPLGESVQPPSLVLRPVLQTSDGTPLAAAYWLPEGEPKANLIILHGFSEYAGALDRVGKAFARQGVAVWAYDQRGFGRTPYRGLWSSAERMAQDAREMARLLRLHQPDKPLYLLGMSMGGAVTLLAAGTAEKLEVDGIVLVAPAVWTRAMQPIYQRWALDAMVKFFPGWAPTGEGLKIRPSDNIAMLRELGRDPWMLGSARMDTLAGLVDVMDKGFAAAADVAVPTLLLYGAKDDLVPKQPIDLLWQRLPKLEGSRQIVYPNGYHMLMRDLQGEQVIHDISVWMFEQ